MCKPGLFPPCPNPCQTTLLGELVYDVKTAVDGTLVPRLRLFVRISLRLSRRVHVCRTGLGHLRKRLRVAAARRQCPRWYRRCSPMPAVGDYRGRSVWRRSRAQSSPTARAQRLYDSIAVACARTSGIQKRRPVTSQRVVVSHEVPVAETQELRFAADSDAYRPVAAQPLRPAASVAQHYQPRRATSLRRANGETLERTAGSTKGLPAPVAVSFGRVEPTLHDSIIPRRASNVVTRVTTPVAPDLPASFILSAGVE